MDRCPVCRAALKEVPRCRRCGSDFSRARAAQRFALALEGEAICRLLAGDADQAAKLLRRARLVHATPTGRALADLLHQQPCRNSVIGGHANTD